MAQSFWFSGPGAELDMCTFDKFPGDVNALWGPHFKNSLVYLWIPGSEELKF